MKIFQYLILALTIFLITSCFSKERYGGRIAVDDDTKTVTPLNHEACFYLAYESLCKKNSTAAQAYLKQIDTFPKSEDKKLIIDEGVKTLWALSYLQENNYEEAAKYMRQLGTVSAISRDQKEGKDEFLYYQLRRIRSASIQMRNSLSALDDYFIWKRNDALSQAYYEQLKGKWHVELKYHIHSKIKTVSYPFPKYN